VEIRQVVEAGAVLVGGAEEARLDPPIPRRPVPVEVGRQVRPPRTDTVGVVVEVEQDTGLVGNGERQDGETNAQFGLGPAVADGQAAGVGPRAGLTRDEEVHPDGLEALLRDGVGLPRRGHDAVSGRQRQERFRVPPPAGLDIPRDVRLEVAPGEAHRAGEVGEFQMIGLLARR